jgi:hypothetical protein
MVEASALSTKPKIFRDGRGRTGRIVAYLSRRPLLGDLSFAFDTLPHCKRPRLWQVAGQGRAGLVSKGKDMKLFVIEGGKGNAAGDAVFQLHAAKPALGDVMAEAARRIEASGYEDWRVREFVTGASMPSALKYLRMQIEFVAEALLRLDPIPEDFRSDTYWPCF